MHKIAIFAAALTSSLASAASTAQAMCHVVTARSGVIYGSYSGPPDARMFRKLGAYAFGQPLVVDRCDYQMPRLTGYWCRLVDSGRYVFHSSGNDLYTVQRPPHYCGAARRRSS